MLFHKNPISRTTSTIFWFPWLLKIHKNHIDLHKKGCNYSADAPM